MREFEKMSETERKILLSSIGVSFSDVVLSPFVEQRSVRELDRLLGGRETE